ncbi:hypothetical protein BC828DRAFT_402705 [Blastocladiella britannica]|nr:hypothetical protein BC828DRAFT_402705 [Blastocladiella britannica]
MSPTTTTGRTPSLILAMVLALALLGVMAPLSPSSSSLLSGGTMLMAANAQPLIHAAAPRLTKRADGDVTILDPIFGNNDDNNPADASSSSSSTPTTTRKSGTSTSTTTKGTPTPTSDSSTSSRTSTSTTTSSSSTTTTTTTHISTPTPTSTSAHSQTRAVTPAGPPQPTGKLSSSSDGSGGSKGNTSGATILLSAGIAGVAFVGMVVGVWIFRRGMTRPTQKFQHKWDPNAQPAMYMQRDAQQDKNFAHELRGVGNGGY